jgi:nucleoside-diphosphate-sugar epimerase
MRYLVTGGAGFIGSHIVERLLKAGHFVRVLDNFSSGKRENLAFVGTVPVKANLKLQKGTVPKSSNFELIEGDIRDKTTCNKAYQGIDIISHQAALRSVPKSMQAPHEYNEVNIDGTVNLLEAARENKIKRFVFASSSSVYGDTYKFPEREDAYPLLISPYALTKLAGEYYCRIFSEHFGLETVCLRYFNVFGPRQALDDEYAVVIPKFIHCILNDQQPPIFGTGKQSRDFTYIDNVVEANILAATQELEGSVPPAGGGTPGLPAAIAAHPTLRYVGVGVGRGASVSDPNASAHYVFNVANGKDNTVLQLVEVLNKIIGKNIKPKFLPVRPGDVFRTCADISRINKILGFKPQVGFEEGLKRTVEYFKNAEQKS